MWVLALTATLGWSSSAFVAPRGPLACHHAAARPLAMTSTRPAMPAVEYDEDDDDDDDEYDEVLGDELRRRAGAVVSPFADTGLTSEGAIVTLELTAANVDMALDEVRPMLVADGGNIEVVDVDVTTGVVKLAMQGSCSTCPSQTVTMQQGVEKTLRRVFPAITSVVAVDKAAAADEGPSELTLESVIETVSQILPAINGMGGSLRVLAATADGKVTVEFKGPARVQYGVDLALRDNKLVKEVAFVAPA
ncbi:hypothetical protein T492DRAFT_617040 [Pavlovales sp. CCMP2436]|nr:hypothetical protein T492DRAFT_617040 [Pavlovales sp. CCMP2436]|mmetsp:Transcript_34534/g.81512  ORF Transcript_34534/g.81512 Transcript_34534/m.81512 type:complete len:249 (+) Transcript_34534:60-806(+)